MASAALNRPRLPVAFPAARPAPNPDDHALLVGINHYEHGIGSLQGALNDCMLFGEWLASPTGGGLDPANIVMFGSVQPSDRMPTQAQVEDILFGFIDRFLRSGMPVGRRLYLYFSGHGVASPRPEDEDCGLVMANSRAYAIQAMPGAATAHRVRANTLFTETVLVMDCCRDVREASSFQSILPQLADPAAPRGPWLHVFAADWGSATGERLLPNPLDPSRPDLPHGVLTHALLKALQTAADASGDITSESLAPVVRRAVEELLPAGSPQRPKVRFDNGLPPILFGKSAGVPITITLADPAQQFTILRGQDLSAVAPPVTRVGTTCTLRLPPGKYIFQPRDAAGRPTEMVIVDVVQGGVDVRF